MANKSEKKKSNETKKVLDDKRLNIMLLGTSGSGKSTLINAFLDTKLEKAPTGIGTAITDRIDVYGDLSKLPFRLIDTPGLEYSHKRQNWLTKEIRKWLKESVKNPDPKTIVHTIWFCVDGSTKRLPEETLRYLQTVSDFWENVPIVFVSTKTYFEEDIEENRRMIEALYPGYFCAECESFWNENNGEHYISIMLYKQDADLDIRSINTKRSVKKNDNKQGNNCKAQQKNEKCLY